MSYYDINGYEHTSISITANDTITITGSSIIHTITVDNASANIILDGVSIITTTSGGNICAFEIKGNSTVSLTLSGTNVLTSTGFRAGLEVSYGNSVTITGATTSDTLDATGGALGGCGIGGGSGSLGTGGSGGIVNISGGTITATGGANGAGIGGGMGSISGGGNGGNGGTVNITGGTVIATGVADGAGIGGGMGGGMGIGGTGGTVNISGGTITVSGGHRDIGGGVRGIGIGGSDSDGADAAIVITGGNVRPMSGAGKVAGQPKNGTTSSSVNVYLNILQVGEGNNLAKSADITSGDIDGWNTSYGFKDVKTDGAGKLYFWLPDNQDGSVRVDTYPARYSKSYERNAQDPNTLNQTLDFVTWLRSSGSHSSCATGAAGGVAIACAAGVVLARRKRRKTRRS